MRRLGLTPWRVFLILWAAFCSVGMLSLLGYRWAIVGFHVFEVAVFLGGLFFIVAALVWLRDARRQEQKRGDAR